MWPTTRELLRWTLPKKLPGVQLFHKENQNGISSQKVSEVDTDNNKRIVKMAAGNQQLPKKLTGVQLFHKENQSGISRQKLSEVDTDNQFRLKKLLELEKSIGGKMEGLEKTDDSLLSKINIPNSTGF